MSIYFNNTTPSNIYYNGAEATLYYNGEQIWPESTIEPYNPLDLPNNTFRIKLVENTQPAAGVYKSKVQVSVNPNIWDVTVGVRPDFTSDYTKLLEVIGANASGCTNMSNSFSGCTALTAVSLFDISNASAIYAMFKGCLALTTVPLYPISNTVTSTQNMFSGCTSLSNVPLFNLSHVQDCSRMFYNCYSVNNGALALYNSLSTQATPPTSYSRTFRNCGRDTVNGAAELAQIPSDWK